MRAGYVDSAPPRHNLRSSFRRTACARQQSSNRRSRIGTPVAARSVAAVPGRRRRAAGARRTLLPQPAPAQAEAAFADGLSRGRPDAQGIAPSAILDFLDEVDRRGLRAARLHALAQRPGGRGRLVVAIPCRSQPHDAFADQERHRVRGRAGHGRQALWPARQGGVVLQGQAAAGRRRQARRDDGRGTS